MKERIFIEKRGSSFVYKYKDSSTEYLADPTSWKMYELKKSLISSGADEIELESLLEMAHDDGYNSAKEEE